MLKENVKKELEKLLVEYDEMKKKKMKNVFIFSGSAAGTTLLFFLLGLADQGGVMSKIRMAILLATFVLLIIAIKFWRDISKNRQIAEQRMHTEVISDLIAAELNGECEVSLITNPLDKNHASPGDILKDLTKVYHGTYNGKNYSITEETIKAVTEVLYNKDERGHKSVSKVKTKESYLGTELTLDSRHSFSGELNMISEDSPVRLDPVRSYFTDNSVSPSLRAVRMDDKNFKFSVYADSDVNAYKYLTPGMMAEINKFKEKYTLTRVDVKFEQVTNYFDETIIDMSFKFKFGNKTLDKLKEAYNYDTLYAMAKPSIERFATLIENVDKMSKTTSC